MLKNVYVKFKQSDQTQNFKKDRDSYTNCLTHVFILLLPQIIYCLTIYFG